MYKTFETPEEMQKAINAYFIECQDREVPYTVEGLCLAIGIDRDTLLNYERTIGYEKFFGTVKEAKLKNFVPLLDFFQ